jgi:hypothetical protein
MMAWVMILIGSLTRVLLHLPYLTLAANNNGEDESDLVDYEADKDGVFFVNDEQGDHDMSVKIFGENKEEEDKSFDDNRLEVNDKLGGEHSVEDESEDSNLRRPYMAGDHEINPQVSSRVLTVKNINAPARPSVPT